MLKFSVIFALLVAASAKRQDHAHGQGHSHATFNRNSVSNSVPVSSDDAHAKVLYSDYNIRHDGFDYHLETSNGIRAKAGGDNYGRIHGDFQWISPEGEHIAVSYVADETGYHPTSHILPTPPPIPEAILKSLKYIASHPSEEKVKHSDNHNIVHHDPDYLFNIRRF